MCVILWHFSMIICENIVSSGRQLVIFFALEQLFSIILLKPVDSLIFFIVEDVGLQGITKHVSAFV